MTLEKLAHRAESQANPSGEVAVSTQRSVRKHRRISHSGFSNLWGLIGPYLHHFGTRSLEETVSTFLRLHFDATPTKTQHDWIPG